MIYLIDTDIIIYSLKNKTIVKNNFKLHSEDQKMLSAISYGELSYGAKKSNNIQKNTSIVKQISELFPIVNVTKSIMETFGNLKVYLQKQGNVIDDMDLIIAATAISMNYILVTNNEKHFSRIPDLQIENWAK